MLCLGLIQCCFWHRYSALLFTRAILHYTFGHPKTRDTMERKQFELMYWAPFIFIIYAVSLFIFLGSWGVIETSEARYAEIAREMFQSGDFVHPQLLNIS